MTDLVETPVDEGADDAPTLTPVQPLYCGACGLPAEYCGNVPATFEKCKPWLREHAAHLYPAEELVSVAPPPGSVADATAAVEGVSLQEGEGGAAAETAAAAPAAAKQGDKKKGVKVPEVVITTNARNKRKFVTVVLGLDEFGVKLPDAAKKFGKRFACSASVVKNASNKDEVFIQGDVKYDLCDILIAKPYNVPRNKIFFIEGKKKLKVRALDSDDDDDDE